MKKGPLFEAQVVEYLRDHGFPHAERRVMGGKNDRGDVAGIPRFAVECKNTTSIDLAGACTEAAKEAANAGEPCWAVIQKRRRHPVAGSYVVMSLEAWTALVLRTADGLR